MKKRLSTLLTLLLIATLSISTADAGGGIKIPSATFTLSSLIADGILKGTGQTDVTVVLKAEGDCTIGDTPFEVTAGGADFLPGNTELGTKKKNTQRAFEVETDHQVGDDGVCHNDPERTDDPGFILWTDATIFVYSGEANLCDVLPKVCDGGIDIGLTSSVTATDNVLLLEQVYTCDTVPEAYSVTCTPVKNNGSNGPNNGAVGICHATGSKKNPYVLLTVKGNGLSGHIKHAGDIIPAPADGCPN